MRVLRAAHLGMCFGVRDAIDLAVDKAGAGPLTILGDLVHNAAVLADPEDRGIAIARESLLEVRDQIQGVQVSAPFGNVKYALQVFEVLDEFKPKENVAA